MTGRESTTLPQGYSWTERDLIDAEEVIKLRASVGWIEPLVQTSIERWQDCLRDSLSVQGIVQDTTQTLTGIAFIAGNIRHAVLCDLTVHQNHQGQGLGKALLLARLDEAKKLGVTYLYTSLSPENSLRSLYQELGFSNTEGNLFRADVE